MEDLPEYCTAGVLVLGCGNPLVGDDGFGPAVAELLLDERAACSVKGAEGAPPARFPLPASRSFCVINAGTGARTIIFNLATGEPRPGSIIIVDALDAGKRPGELFEPPLESLSLEKSEDFNIHMTPASNMLLKLQKLGVEIRILACQPAALPGRIRPGLSKEVVAAVGPAARRVLELADEILKKPHSL